VTEARITQQYVEAAGYSDNPEARVTQQYIEVAYIPDPSIRPSYSAWLDLAPSAAAVTTLSDASIDKSAWQDKEPSVLEIGPPDYWGWLDEELRTARLTVSIESAWKMIPPAPTWALPSTQPRREVFICTLKKTGLADVEVPMANLQMRRRDGNPTMISCVIPDAETYLDYAKDRKNGEIIIYAGSITEDGTRHLSELERVSLDSISYDIGVRSSSLVISGYRTETNINPRPVDIEGVTYYGLQADGKRRIRAKINQFLRPGDTAIYGDGSFVVDQIYVFIEPKNAWMEAAGL
jgi:hypothetical protein